MDSRTSREEKLGIEANHTLLTGLMQSSGGNGVREPAGSEMKQVKTFTFTDTVTKIRLE